MSTHLAKRMLDRHDEQSDRRHGRKRRDTDADAGGDTSTQPRKRARKALPKLVNAVDRHARKQEVSRVFLFVVVVCLLALVVRGRSRPMFFCRGCSQTNTNKHTTTA